MVANGDGKGRSAGSVDDAAAMRLLSKLYERDEDLDEGPARPSETSKPAGVEHASESLAQAEAEMRELRSVFATMRESMSEEPPVRGLDALLLAARENVATVSKTVARQAVTEQEPGFWEKLRRGWMSMLAHPGVMAAAALVVVAGAAGTIYVKTGAVDGGASEQATRNSVTTTLPQLAAAPTARDISIAGNHSTAAPTAATGSASNSALRFDDRANEYKPTDDKNVKGDTTDVSGGLSSDGDKGTERVGATTSKTAPSTGKKNVAVLQEGTQQKKPRANASADLEFQVNGTGDASEGASAMADEEVTAEVVPVAPEPTKQSGRVSSPTSPPPPPPAPATRAAPATPIGKAPAVQRDNNTVDDDRPAVKPQAVQVPALQPVALLAAAKLGATNGDCVRARSLAEQARTTDKRAYDLALKNDATLRACFKP